MSLLLFFAGASTGTTPPTPARVVGWPGKRRRIRQEVLEELLRQQDESGGPFTPRRYELLIGKLLDEQGVKGKARRKIGRKIIAELQFRLLDLDEDEEELLVFLIQHG